MLAEPLYRSRKLLSANTIVLFFLFYPLFQLFWLKGLYILALSGFVMTILLELKKRKGGVWHIPNYAPVYLFYTLPLISVLWIRFPDQTLFRGTTVLLNLVIFYLSAHATYHTSCRNMRSLLIIVPLTLFVSAACIFILFGTFRAVDYETGKFIQSFSNHAAATVILCVPLLIAFWQIDKSLKDIYTLAIFACVIIVILSLSRAALGLLVLSFIFSAIFTPGRLESRALKLLQRFAIALLLIGVLTFFLGYEQTIGLVVERLLSSQVLNLENILHPRNYLSDYGRAAMYSTGLSVIQNNPIWGIGYGGLIEVMQNRFGFGFISHNIIITYWGEMGIPGLVALFWFIFRVVGIQKSQVRDEEQLWTTRVIASGALVATIVALIYSLFRPFESNFMFPVVLGITFAIQRLRKSTQRK